MIENLSQDLRYTWRTLLKSPGFALVALLTLALGIGANSAIFSVINAALLRPLPYPHPDQLVLLYERAVAANGSRNPVSLGNFLDWQAQSRSFTAMAVERHKAFNLGGSGQAQPERINGAICSWSMFPALGISPAIGRPFTADEDKQGEPFVGRAGQLLTRIIETMGLTRQEVYIANILKCRPDTPSGSFGNRPPTPREMQTCRPYLLEQIDVIEPKVLVALGAVAVEGLLGARGTMRELRGRWHSYNGTPLMITYHPAYLLRNQTPSEKRKVWEDMLQVLERLKKPITEKQRNYFL